jgi:hypothetical protein
MYRDDEKARVERAGSLIDEIGELERQKVTHAATDQRLDEARRELSTLQAHTPSPRAPEKRAGVITHALVFGITAGAAYLGYTLLI